MLSGASDPCGRWFIRAKTRCAANHEAARIVPRTPSKLNNRDECEKVRAKGRREMATGKRNRKDDLTDEQKFFWFMTTAYVLSAIGLLDQEKEQKLDSLDEYGAGNWKECARGSLGVDAKFIRSVYALCSEYRDRQQSIGFILRGLGCPCVEERLAEFSELV